MDGDDLVLTGRSRADDPPLYQNHGSLTPAGRARLGAALSELDDASLDPVYGCPDCADGGAAYLELSRDGVSERVGMELGNPPDVLAGLYGVSASLIGALETCRSNELVEVVGECTVYQG